MDPTDPRLRFGFHLVTLARRWRRELDRQLAAAGLTDATWTPLIHLEMSGDGISQKELAGLVGIEGPSLVRLLDALVERGLVERHTDGADRRSKRILLTPAGRAAVADIRRLLARSEADMLRDLDDGELAAMLDGFDRIAHRLSTLRERSA
ncbi:MarR family transcriptional regulator [Azospirillum sp. TSO35-2]|uniref:MarR family winged helix-turn-helix transcriptional regulator n=1 Tax=Azospirillum sp. TSO35-2 TaxID=716796 RepID=UPI000D605BE4|nr:MarR family transcriptional regulator [Azospirillum sp. TSO35-2]PWC39766.1 hypothetical protein TSO352_06650 [Azospirillum sp. TSO35-2]